METTSPSPLEETCFSLGNPGKTTGFLTTEDPLDEFRIWVSSAMTLRTECG